MPEGLEGLGLAEEAVEGLVVELLDELGPDLPDAGHVALAHGPVHVGEVGALLQTGVPRGGHVAVDLRQVVDGLRVVRLALEVDDRGGGVGRERVGERLGLQAHQVDVVLEGGGGRREAHRAHLGRELLVAALEADGAQPAADLVRLVDDGLEAHLHQLVRGDDARQTAADDRDLGAVLSGRYLADARRVGEEVVVGEGEVRPEHGDGRLDGLRRLVLVVGGGGHRGRHRRTLLLAGGSGVAGGGAVPGQAGEAQVSDV